MITKPYIKLGGEMDVIVLMYERIRLPKVIGDLVSNLSATYYDCGKKDGNGGAKRQNLVNEGDDEGLRLSKRLKAKK